jgi:DNA repair protein RecN (Recombination protein N)
MLEYLKICNIALIGELEVMFGGGLNILTGETGAGKSILIDSINFVLGQRAGKEIIRTGCAFAQVDALVSVNGTEKGKETEKLLAGFGVELNYDRSLLLSRHFTDSGKNICKVNGKVVTVGTLKEISELLIDIHGQHEHQSLLQAGKHIGLLDRLCGDELAAVLGELSERLKQRREIAKKIKELADGGGEAYLELYKGQIIEIEKAKLKRGEEEALNDRKRLAKNAERLSEAVGRASAYLSGAGGALDRLSAALPHLDDIGGIDKRFEPVSENFADICDRLRDACAEAAVYFGGVESGESLDEIEERLDLIYKLKKKFAGGAGSAVDDVLSYLETAKEKVEFIENSAEMLDRLNEQRRSIEREAAATCAKASKIRKRVGAAVSAEATEVLRDLGMKQVMFEIRFERKNEFTPLGFDKVEFMISPNRGEPLKPLSKIASGGEMSRVMLALKTVLAAGDCIETFIFDEIDAGISGRTAQSVAEKLLALSRRHQILCITHLPQIAAMADEHFLISKNFDGEMTYTSVQRLCREKSVGELARLIGGAVITETTIRSAEEMKGFKVNKNVTL